jgi:predicted DCC family thiol-disulfide oxidoreductase YuxK
MDEGRRIASWHLVDEKGVVRSAGAVVAPLSRLLPGAKPAAILADLFPRGADLVYRVVAANRERLGRMLGEQACAVDPAARARSDHPR